MGPNFHFICPFMEMFHPFKVLMEKIWAYPGFYCAFWAPLQHVFYPDTGVFLKPNLKQIEATLLCVRLAYPVIRARLHAFLKKLKNQFYHMPETSLWLWNSFCLWYPFIFYLPSFVCISPFEGGGQRCTTNL